MKATQHAGKQIICTEQGYMLRYYFAYKMAVKPLTKAGFPSTLYTVTK